jgi:threonine dehydrogenase-like Zn-dependent dehydrogenase
MKPPRIDLPLTLFCVGELGVLGSFASHGEDLAEVLRREAAGLFAIEAAISHRLPLVRVADGVETFRAKAGDPQRTVIEMPV